MNEVLTALKTRRSIRKFRSDPVPQALLDEIMEAGLYAASGMDRQKTIILCLTDPDVIARLSRANAQIAGYKEGTDPFYGAPAVLVVLSPKEVPTALYDGSLVLGNLMTAPTPWVLVPAGFTGPMRNLSSLCGRNFSASWALKATISASDTASLAIRTNIRKRPPAGADASFM